MQKKKSFVAMFIALLFLWMMLAPRLSVPQLIIGSGASLIVLFYSHDLLFNNDEAAVFTVRNSFTIIGLFGILLKDIVVANIDVARIVLRPSLPIEPTWQSLRQPLKRPLLQALYGNSITLTPGTLSVIVNENEILIHTLTQSAAKNVATSKIKTMFERLDGGGAR